MSKNQPNNYLRERARAAAPSAYSKRTPERVLMCVGALYSMIMAIFYALAYAGLIPGAQEAAQSSAGTVSALTHSGGNTALISLYVIVTIAIAVLTVIVAARDMAPGPRVRRVTGWMIFLLVFSLITVDMVALIAFGVAFGLYMTRDWSLTHPAKSGGKQR
ncbi:hypothetical protein D2E25_1803 [Bifidobacterium goeldii]|uniref:Uncharacterized protein n=1 Tax=Bifidobacterium goeldii TaxID=2306975 RepID=A0A430FEU1_9BIFI|nr:hypothetical protein [Bifidobacterium goeldii]RSX51369.1 hypothetical protein D2E25_1803 [Bifidobacterium goeldii]